MAASASEMKIKLMEKLHATHVEVIDISNDCGQRFSVTIVSSEFAGKSLLKSHQMVNECLTDELKQIHALTIKTFTPEKWDNRST
jgi:stress-induced morphogen